MDADELFFLRSLPDEEYLDDSEFCIYCGKESDNLNIVHYEWKEGEGDIKLIAVNPMPHERIPRKEGYNRLTQKICDECLKDELNELKS